MFFKNHWQCGPVWLQTSPILSPRRNPWVKTSNEAWTCRGAGTSQARHTTFFHYDWGAWEWSTSQCWDAIQIGNALSVPYISTTQASYSNERLCKREEHSLTIRWVLSRMGWVSEYSIIPLTHRTHAWEYSSGLQQDIGTTPHCRLRNSVWLVHWIDNDLSGGYSVHTHGFVYPKKIISLD